MLYVTTRSSRDAFTAYRALCENRGPDGGLYVPFHLMPLSEEEIQALVGKSFNRCVAEMLNRMFNTRLSAWDVDFCIGRYSVRLEKTNQRILIGECWHNLEWEFPRMIRALAALVRGDQNLDIIPGDWTCVGVRIAVLFGIFGELMRAEIAGAEKAVDVIVTAGDFSAVMGAWYARYLGLPVGNIVICCNDNGNIWNLFHQGQMRTDTVAVNTDTPQLDITLPAGLERLIYACGGMSEVHKYVEICRRGGSYCPDEVMLSRLRCGIHVSVISQRRMEATILNVYANNHYLLSPYAALQYSGLMDYRSRTGESRYALILSERSPELDKNVIAKAIGINPHKSGSSGK